MPTSDCPGHFPAFVAPSHSNHQRCPGYVPGRVAPVRSPTPSKGPPPPPLKPHGLRLEQRTAPSLSVENQRRVPSLNLRQRKNTLICCGVSLSAFFLTLILVLSLTSGDELDGRVVFADNVDGSRNITLRTHHILIEDGGALHIGSPKCRYRSRATIALMGRSDNKDVPEVRFLGRKFIGVMSGGTLELHGTERVSWSLLTRSIPASGLATGDYAFQKNFSRGINFRVFDPDTSALLYAERYDTHDSWNDSLRLTQLLRSLPAGRIVAMAVGDSAVKSLVDETKKAIKEVLGSRFAYDLKYR
ncbi:hypothetical protein GOODEAATRI_023914 [Goodea atripinnis]|uniref:G8 domain-containing protein n=1 Tax=Goodea atripinnis TaxID=208336 RepID=A0ABV0P7C6_9TELE